ncbi:ABC transporter permease [Sabulicella glaciei]|uniref:ABC transporter permease n=1 Tax=Sabulicella glaciei TaxID=2984948 RepID=A0ABT3NPD6_9PROT|nr:ABC transporter permease [Roseococcus sp. MDT2-1-1]MCW8084021.1 ABC transporter permease [Roseococcus sp. MDT2-1-1]
MSGARGLGAALLLLLGGLALLGPSLLPDPALQDLRSALQPPGTTWWLGTDHLGRSVLARAAHALRFSLTLAATAVGIAVLLGTGLGLLAASLGGLADRALAALGDATLALPGLLLVMVVVAFAPGEILPLSGGVALAQWVHFFRVARAEARRVLALPHAEAARVLGFGPDYVLRRLVLPELRPILLTLVGFGLGTAVLQVAALSFVGVGVRPPTPELGSMTTELLPYLPEAPVQALVPAVLVAMLVLGFQLLSADEGQKP